MEKENFREEKLGIGLKVFGIILIILGSLNLVLCWRGGLPINPFFPVILAAGIGFYVIGKIRGTSEAD